MLFSNIRFLLWVTAVFLVTSCITPVNLKYPTVSPGAQTGVYVAIDPVKDLRPQDEAKEDRTLVGVLRGGFGNTFPVSSKKGTEIAKSLHSLLTDAALGAGLQISTDDSVPSLAFEVKEFWMDGYMGYKVTADIVLIIRGPKSGTELFRKSIKASDGFMMWGMDSVFEAFDVVMKKVIKKSVEILKSEEVTKILKTR